MTAPTYQVHEYAKFFPPIEGEEFDALVADVKAHGVIEPIMLYEGKILDGVNRYRAAKKAGVTAKFETFRENGHGSALDYVISENIRRRHLNSTQKAVLVREFADKFRDEGNAKKGKRRASENGEEKAPREFEGQTNPAARRAAALVGVGQATIRRVQFVAEHAPDLVPKMRDGTLEAKAADHIARERMAERSVKRITDQRAKWQVENEPRLVAHYIEATATFITEAERAVNPASYKRFSPEAQRFVKRRHDRIREMLTRIEGHFDA